MSQRYNQEAVETCRGLYLKYGGKNFEAIERGMHKAGYAGWTLKNLNDRGREGKPTWRMGWINRYGFDRSLKLNLERLATRVNNDEQDLYLGIKTIRKQLQNEAIGAGAGKDVRREFREYAKIEIEARRNLDLTRDNFDTFVSGYEKLLNWSPDIDAALAKLLAKHTEKFADMAKAHYGKDEADDGADLRADEGGGEPFSLITG